jgi:uncharacterized protein (DUF2267 family)
VAEQDRAYQALRGTLHALRDILRLEEAVQLAAQLPLLIKGVFYDGWTPLDKPQKYKKEEFARRVHEQFQFDPELKDVKSNMPKDIQEWFPKEIGQIVR